MNSKGQPRGISHRNQSPTTDDRGERLHKVLAAAGVASRRECEVLITEGRVQVDRETVTQLGTRVDPMQQEIRVDGSAIRRPRRTYFLVNKPVGVVSTNRDPQGRPRVVDLVPDVSRMFTVGRLDRSSEGLILVTNDGELSNRLTHPRYEIPKTYRARVAGHPTPELLRRLRKGIHLADGVARVASIHVKKRQTQTTELEIVLTEGRNREIRRVLARIGHKVLQLRRVGMGPLRLGQLPVGSCRPLSADEVRQLRRFAKQLSTGGNRRAGGSPQKKRRPRTRVEKPAGKPKKTSTTSARRGTVLDYDGQRDTGKATKPVKRASRKRGAKPARTRPARTGSTKATQRRGKRKGRR